MKNLSFFRTFCGAQKPPCGVQSSFCDVFSVLKTVGFQKLPAFSLVELLMALLVASLLMAALAPVMTKRLSGETITANVTGNGVRGDYSRTFYEDFEWNVPSGVNIIKVTSVGDGGAGGGSTYGYKEITASVSNWTVPEGVTKLRVF